MTAPLLFFARFARLYRFHRHIALTYYAFLLLAPPRECRLRLDGLHACHFKMPRFRQPFKYARLSRATYMPACHAALTLLSPFMVDFTPADIITARWGAYRHQHAPALILSEF